MGDDNMSKVLEAFLVSGVSPLVEFKAAENSLTRVPQQLEKFPKLSLIDLSHNNIKTITCFSFLTASDVEINLNYNEITTVEDQFNVNSTITIKVNLANNQIKDISDDAFQGN